MSKKNSIDNFAIGKAIRIDPTNKQVNQHNEEDLNHHLQKGQKLIPLRAVDRITDAIKDISNIKMEKLIPEDINKLNGYPNQKQYS